ncbi:B12-binding domain-containing radical SAM protein [Desulfovirgula thermocuniculi]|uniref:B12-binding domain-containing radical SAM protein n=1 Tax=Desulfovirgula thermocuniculi TaxID=348842 RepID=UPI00041A146B|nr:radical SAM protein [Desulfovirgula thermocuniculi]
MRVVLLNPPLLTDHFTRDLVVNAPLSACLLTGYAGACLRQAGFEVTILDADLAGWSIAETGERLLTEDFVLLGVHLKFLWDRTAEVMEMLRAVKEGKPGIFLALYGHYPTFAAGELLCRFPFVDAVVLGEPEITLVELARSLAGRRHAAWQDIVGLAFRRHGVPVRNPWRPPVKDLDALPFPLRPDPALAARRHMHNYILGSRGCFGRCSFCYLNRFYGPRMTWRGRSPANIAAEVERVYAETGNPSFYFADANFFGPGVKGRRRALEMARLLKKLPFPLVFGLECRASDVDEEVFSSLAEVGLRDVFLGVESGVQAALDRFRKGTTVAQNERAIETLRRLGLNLSLGFINFDPGTTLEEVQENLEFLKRMGLLDRPSTTAHLFFHRQVVLRGTPAYDELSARGALEPAGFTGYEGRYLIADLRAEAVARVMGVVARWVLDVTGGEDLEMGRKEGASGAAPGAGSLKDGPRAGREEVFRRLNAFLQDFLAHLLEAAERGELHLHTVPEFVAAGCREVERIASCR